MSLKSLLATGLIISASLFGGLSLIEKSLEPAFRIGELVEFSGTYGRCIGTIVQVYPGFPPEYQVKSRCSGVKFGLDSRLPERYLKSASIAN